MDGEKGEYGMSPEPVLTLPPVDQEHLEALDRILLHKKLPKEYRKIQEREMGKDEFLTKYLKTFGGDFAHYKHDDHQRVFDGSLIMFRMLTDAYGKIPPITKDTKRVVHGVKVEELLDPNTYSSENPLLMERIPRDSESAFGLSLRGIGMMAAYAIIMTRLQGKDLNIPPKGRKR